MDFHKTKNTNTRAHIHIFLNKGHNKNATRWNISPDKNTRKKNTVKLECWTNTSWAALHKIEEKKKKTIQQHIRSAYETNTDSHTENENHNCEENIKK